MLGEGLEEAVVAGDRVVEVARLRGAAEAGQVRGDRRRSARGTESSRTSRSARRAGTGPERRPSGSQWISSPATSACSSAISMGAGSYHHALDGRPAQAPQDPRQAPQGVRASPAATASRAGRRADPHGALAEHERPQPRRRLRPSARALRVLGRGARRAGRRRSRTRSGRAGSRRPRPCGSSRSSRRSATTTSPGSPTRRSPRAATTSCELPGVGRKTAACVLLFSFGPPDVPVDTHVYRVGLAARAVAREGELRRGARRDAAARRRRRAGGLRGRTCS